MTMSKRERVLVCIVLVLAVFCLYYLFFLNPYLKEKGEIDLSLVDKQTLASTSDQEKLILAGFDKAIAENEAKLAELSGDSSANYNQPDALVYLYRTVNQFAEKTYVEFRDSMLVNNLEVIPASATMVSSYDGIKQVLAAFAEGPYFLKVVSLKVAKIAEEETEVTPPPADDTAPETPAVQPTKNDSDKLSVTIELEFFNSLTGTEDTAARDYTEGYQYGGDIFN